MSLLVIYIYQMSKQDCLNILEGLINFCEIEIGIGGKTTYLLSWGHLWSISYFWQDWFWRSMGNQKMLILTNEFSQKRLLPAPHSHLYWDKNQWDEVLFSLPSSLIHHLKSNCSVSYFAMKLLMMAWLNKICHLYLKQQNLIPRGIISCCKDNWNE